MGGDERAGCYSVRAPRKHKQRLDSVQPDVGGAPRWRDPEYCGYNKGYSGHGEGGGGGSRIKGHRELRPRWERKTLWGSLQSFLWVECAFVANHEEIIHVGEGRGRGERCHEQNTGLSFLFLHDNMHGI